MSLIDDALRRVNDPTKSDVASAPGAEQPVLIHHWPVETARQIPARSSRRAVWILAVAGALAAVVVVGGWWSSGRWTKLPTPPHASSASEPTAPASRPPEEFVVSGIVEGLGEPYAVINGAIVGVGEQVGDATLIEITANTVRLRRPDGRETTAQLLR